VIWLRWCRDIGGDRVSVRFLSDIADGLLQGLERIAFSFSSTKAFNNTLDSLGWTVTVDDTGFARVVVTFAGSDPFEPLEAVIGQIESGAGDPVTLVGQLFDGIKAIVTQIRTAISTPPGSLPTPLNDPSFWSDSAVTLIDKALIERIENRQPVLFAAMTLIGFFDISKVTPAGASRKPYTRYSVRWDRLPQLLSDPEGLVRSVYGWGSPALDTGRFVAISQRVLEAVRLPVRAEPLDPTIASRYYSAGNPALGSLKQLAIPIVSSADANRKNYVEFGVLLFPIPSKGQPGSAPVGFAIAPLASGAVSGLQVPNDSPFSVTIGAGFQTVDAFDVQIRPDSVDVAVNSGSANIDASIAVAGKPASPWILFGDADGSRLEVYGLKAGIALKGSAGDIEVVVSAGMDDGQGKGAKLVIDLGDGDGFLQDILGSSPQELDFAGAVSWSSESGISLSGQAKLNFTIPVHLSLAGVIDINRVDIGLGGSPSGADLDIAVTGDLSLGPISASVDRIGIRLSLTPTAPGAPPGNLDKLELGFGFKPPNGLGLSLDLGVVSGGGYILFDSDNKRYAGVLEVSIADIVTVKVIGVLDTILPDGSSGYSLLFIITFDLPPIQLGFGFTLNGVGGLGGVNRTMVLSALQAGLRAHSLDHVLFPPDPVKNAPQIISDIESFFPPQQGRYLFGPMLSIGWGTPTLLDIEVGVILEVPEPIRLAILGAIRVAIPSPDFALIKLNIDVLGTVDFGLEKLAIDGTMYDSYVLEFQISGDAALRFSWGDNPNFLYSLGGFNPHFQPPPDVPQLQRLSISLGAGDNPRLSSNSYFAVTSNSLQFGANVDAYAAAGGFSIHGYIGFDALFIFSPFSFEIDFSAGFDIAYDGHSFAGIHLDASLSGPRPFHLHGDASLHILFFDVSVTVDLSWGKSTPAVLPSAPVLPPLIAALGDSRNWSVALPSQSAQAVTLRTITPDPSLIVAHPMGTLSVRENVVPLDIPITKFNGASPSDGNQFAIASVAINSESTAVAPYQEDFAVAQYTDMSDADKLSVPSYEPFDAGVTIGGAAIANGHDSPRTVTYVEKYIDDFEKPIRFGKIVALSAVRHAELLGSGLAKDARTRTEGLKAFTTPDLVSPISVGKTRYVVAGTEDLAMRNDVLAAATSRYAAVTAMQSWLALHPEDKDALQVVTEREAA
jgi:hypothetical protein